MIQTHAIANRVANRLTNTDGPMKAIDIMVIFAIIEILLPIIVDCFDPDDGEQVQEYIDTRYSASAGSDDKYGGYQRSLVRALTRRAKFAALKNRTRITFEQARETAIATLDELRENDTQELSLAIRESAQ